MDVVTYINTMTASAKAATDAMTRLKTVSADTAAAVKDDMAGVRESIASTSSEMTGGGTSKSGSMGGLAEAIITRIKK